MVTLCRASRNTEYWQMSTPQAVGPGSYSSSPLRKALDYTAAPFSSMTARPLSSHALAQTRGSQGETPGPGSYEAAVRYQSRSGSKGSNSFVSAESRMAPNAPGSTVFAFPSSILNPGPGAYNLAKGLAKKKQSGREKPRPLLFELNSGPPSIPPQLGTEPTNVGPGQYSPSHACVKPKPASTDFSHSKDIRRLWEPSNSPFNRQPSRSNPGPGSYEGSILSEPESSSGNVSFISKVRRQKKAVDRSPGPGVYEVTQRTEFDLVQRPGFGGKVQRGETWSHDIVSPYTKPERGKYPGVGTYDIDDLHRKAKESKRRSLLYTLVPPPPKAPFLTDQQRDCLVPLRIGLQPGPGAYDPAAQPDTQSHNLQVSLGKVTFASKQDRFRKQVFQAREGPAPGQYQASEERPTGKATDPAFKSRTSRFPREGREGPSVGAYEMRGEWRTKQSRAEDYQHVMPGVSFESSSLRFDSTSPISGKKDLLPGPGQYLNSSLPLSKGAGMAKSKRFQGFAVYQAVGVTAPAVGPGRYDLQGSLLRKSFNRTMEVSKET